MTNFFVLFISACIALTSSGVVSPEAVMKSNIGSTHEEAAMYIEENMDVFKTIYNDNKKEDEPEFKANEVEFKAIVFNTITNEYNTYLDFNGNNGYVLVANNYELYSFETEGDLYYLRDYQGCIYFDCGGFCYYRVGFGFFNFDKYYYLLEYTDIELQNYFDAEMEKSEALKPSSALPPTFALTADNLDSYVYGKYGKYISSSNSLPVSLSNFEYSTQMQNTVLKKRLGNFYTSEGNCALNALYQVLRYWRDVKGKSNLASDADCEFNIFDKTNSYGKHEIAKKSYVAKSGYEYLNLQNKYILRTFMDEEIDENCTDFSHTTAYGCYKNDIKNSTSFSSNYTARLPRLYYDILMQSVEWGYVYGGFTFNSLKLSSWLTYKYGYSNTVGDWIYNYSAATIMFLINSGNPVLLSTTNDSFYVGGHATVINGYKIYSNKQKLSVFVSVNQSLFTVQLADGHSATPTWMDLPNVSYLRSRKNWFASKDDTELFKRFSESYIRWISIN